MTQRIEPLTKIGSNNWTFFWTWLNELNFFFQNLTQRIEPFFLNITLRIELSLFNVSKDWTFFKILLKELNPFQNMVQRIELRFQYDAKNQPFFPYDSTKLIFSIWFKKWTFFNMTQNIELFFFGSKNWTFVFTKKHDTQNWTIFFEYDSLTWTHFLNMTQRIELFLSMTQWIEPFCLEISLKGLNLSFKKYDSMNWTLFEIRLQELNSFFNMTRRI